MKGNITHLMWDLGGTISFVFPRQSQGEHQDSRENQTSLFPEGLDIKYFVIFLDRLSFQQWQKNARSKSKQSTQYS